MLARAGAGAAPQRPAPKAAKPKIPPAEEITGRELVTGDGVALSATFYPGTKGRESVPVILLHMWKGSRKDYAELAHLLQQNGHAVLVPDLRGHGDSKRWTVGARSGEVDVSRLTADHLRAMVQRDMETLKAFLMKKNNAGELNIEKLCVVGAEMGASVALDWARHDWSWPPLVGKKQGQDVKALVLISPQWAFRGFSLKPAMNHPAVRSRLSVMLLVGGDDPKAASEVRQMERIFQRYHREETEDSKMTLVVRERDTRLQGTDMLGAKKGLGVETRIEKFIDYRLVAQPFSWQER